MKKNNTKKNRAGFIITAVAMALTAVFAAGTVSAGAVNIQKTASYSQTVAAANETLAMSIAKKVYAGHDLKQADYSSDVILVDGERVYMDTRHLPPANTGTAVHVQAFGKTSYGFNWTCSCDNQNYVISCNYNFSKNMYDFVIFGKEPGHSNISIYYNTGDTVRQAENVHLFVDNNLNATRLAGNR